MHSFTNHRTLACIFKPETCVASVSRTAAQKLEQWKTVLGQHDKSITHIGDGRNCWRHPLSRWMNVPSMSVRAAAVFASSEPDEMLLSKDTICGKHAQAWSGVTAADKRVSNDDEGSFRMNSAGRDVLWIPPQVEELPTRLIVRVPT